jgi:type II secretory pathway pseudopilin PulG
MLRREDGFTVAEMVTAMAIAVIISLAAFALIETVMTRSAEVSGRVDATQRGRGAMDEMTRELRSQVCVIRSDPSWMTSARSIYSATATQIVFFADTADESYKTATDTMPVPTLRTLTFTPAAGAKGTIVETIRPGVRDTSKPGVDGVSFAVATNDRNRTLLTNIEQVVDPADGKLSPVFRYYAYDTTKVPPTPTKELLPGAGSLDTAAVSSIAKITVNYRVRAAGKVTQRPSITLKGEIFVRTVDPNTSNPKPTCL